MIVLAGIDKALTDLSFIQAKAKGQEAELQALKDQLQGLRKAREEETLEDDRTCVNCGHLLERHTDPSYPCARCTEWSNWLPMPGLPEEA